jgi:flagellar basal-body rod modification protein FlgD
MATTNTVTGPGTTQTLNALTNTGGTTALDKTAFLKLLVEQLKNQDPLKPQDDSAFVAQLAQFSSLEQSMTMNDKLDTMTAQIAGLSNSQSTNLVGSEATVRGNLITVDGTGVGAPLAFDLSGAAASTTVTITNQSGTAIRTITGGAHAPGVAQMQWDGRDDAGTIQPAGSYQVTVTAKDAAGNPVSVNQQTSGQVMNVSFDKGYPVLQLDTGVSVPVSDLLQISAPPQTPTNNK